MILLGLIIKIFVPIALFKWTEIKSQNFIWITGCAFIQNWECSIYAGSICKMQGLNSKKCFPCVFLFIVWKLQVLILHTFSAGLLYHLHKSSEERSIFLSTWLFSGSFEQRFVNEKTVELTLVKTAITWSKWSTELIITREEFFIFC